MKEKKAALVMGYWESADLVNLHQHSLRWMSEIKYWMDELEFMQNLLEKHFLYFFEKERRDFVVPLATKFGTTFKTELAQLQHEVQMHEIQLASFIKSNRQNEEKTYRAQHAKIEKQIQDFELSYRNAKQELFEVADDVLKEEKMKKIIAMAG